MIIFKIITIIIIMSLRVLESIMPHANTASGKAAAITPPTLQRAMLGGATVVRNRMI